MVPKKLCKVFGTILALSLLNPSATKATTEEENIGKQFCSYSNLELADNYLKQLANKALFEYSNVVQSGGSNPEYYYYVAYVGINDYCNNKTIITQLVNNLNTLLKKLESNQKDADEYNLTFRKLYILTLEGNEKY